MIGSVRHSVQQQALRKLPQASRHALPAAVRAADQALVDTSKSVAKSSWRDALAELKGKATNAGASALIWMGDVHPALTKLGHKIYGFATRTIDGPPLQKLGQLGDKVLRGAQPTPEGFEQLSKQGVKTIINLRPENNVEKELVERLGMKAVFLPLPPLDAPTHAETLSFLKSALDLANGKVFFHCYHGVDRTGTMAAAIRIARDGWSAERAIGELNQFGFHVNGQQAKLRYITEFESFWKTLPADRKAEALHQAAAPQAPTASRFSLVG